MTQNRTHTCGELRLSDAGKAIKICGWLENLREVGSELAFAVVRDFYGTTQVVAETADMVALLKSINKESTISVEGTVRERDSKNAKLPTGEIEVVPGKIEVLGRCQHNELPFPINRSREADEATRLKYRYLDLRNPAVKNNIILRCQVVAALRQAIARDLREYKGMAVPPEQIVVGAGAEYLYLLLAQLLGREAVFAVEDPGYPKIRQVYGKCGAACRPVPLDGQGVPPEALEAARSIYGVRQALAALFGCSRADRVAFTPNSTMALNIAISGLLGAGDHVISTALEHNSVLRPLYRLRAQGGAVDFVPADRQGRIDYEDFERLLRPNTKAVVCTHGSNLTGDLMDIQRVGNFCQKHRLLFILDASQTAGVFPIDMERQHISVVCFTGHKSLMGPQGTGGLCVGAGVEIRPFAVGGTGVQSYSETQPEAYPTRLEAGTLNSHGIAGLGASLAFLKRTGWDAVRTHESVLARRFYETVRTIPGVKVYGNFAVQLRAPIVSLNIADLDSSEVADELAERFEIATRPGAHCAPRLHRALGTEDQGAVRFSWSYFNTEAETDAAAEAVRILAAEAV